jgi:hypothetical protein
LTDKPIKYPSLEYPAPTLKEKIAAGPRFDTGGDHNNKAGLQCVCGAGERKIDAKTGLCPPCWRVWRWSSVRERETP